MIERDLSAARDRWLAEAETEAEKRKRIRSDFLCYCNHDGLFADFHGLRHLFISSLERAGVTPKMAQTLARHSDIRLTLGVYTHVELDDQTAAIEALPAPPSVKMDGDDGGEAALGWWVDGCEVAAGWRVLGGIITTCLCTRQPATSAIPHYAMAATLDTGPRAKSYPDGGRTHLSMKHFQFAPDPLASKGAGRGNPPGYPISDLGPCALAIARNDCGLTIAIPRNG